MRQGFVSAVLSELDFKEVIDFASENGFDCVEMACWPMGKAERRYGGVSHIDVDHLDEEKRDEILSYCKEKKVDISALAYYPNTMDSNLEKREFYISHLKKVISAAKKLNVGMVTTFIGRMTELPLEENLEEYVKVWTPIVDFAKENKVKIAIENCPMLFTQDEWPGGQNLACTPAIWREMFHRLDSEYLGINYDPSHFIWQKIDYIKPIYEFKDKIFHVHYKDIKLFEDKLLDVGVLATPLSYMSPRIPGHGDVDWGKYIAALMDIGYNGSACIEIEDKSFEDSLEHIKDSLVISKRYLSQFI